MFCFKGNKSKIRDDDDYYAYAPPATYKEYREKCEPMFKRLRETLHSSEPTEPEPEEYFDYKKIGRVGFPSKPSCTAHDPKLSIQYIGTEDSFIHAYGGGMCHWIARIPWSENGIVIPRHIYPIHGKGQAMIICNNSNIYRVGIRGSDMIIKEIQKDNRCKEIKAASLLQNREDGPALLLLGSSAGNIFRIDTQQLIFDEFIAFELICKSNERSSINHLACSPDGKHLAIVLSTDHVVLFNSSINEVVKDIHIQEKIFGLHWCSDKTLFICLHDGSYAEFNMDNPSVNLTPKCVFGPFPALPIRKICRAKPKFNGSELLIFTDGLPSASFGDRNVVTIKTDKNVLCFDFESPVVSFDVTQTYEGEEWRDNCLLVLTKNELVAIDLRDSKWRTIPTKGLFPMDCHVMTSSVHVENVAEHVWDQVLKLSENFWNTPQSSPNPFPLNAYPVQTGKPTCSINSAHERQYLITGHDDGSINIFTMGAKCSTLLLTIKTSSEFDGISYPAEEKKSINEKKTEDGYISTDSDDTANSMVNMSASDQYPPFRKVGVFDPFCDDPRTAIVKLAMDPNTGMIVAGTKSGAVLLYQIYNNERTLEPIPDSVHLLNNVSSDLKLTAGSQPLHCRPETNVFKPGYQPFSAKEPESFLLQLYPPNAVTAVAILSSRNMISVGNEYGFTVINYVSRDKLITKSFASTSDIAQSSLVDNTWGTFKSMKKSIRQTFRRKKKQPDQNNKVLSDSEDEDIVRPVERKIEARTTLISDTKPYLVRLTAFLKTPSIAGNSTNDTLWVANNSGQVLCYNIIEKPREKDTLKLEKELKLSHAAPIIHLQVVNEPYKSSPHPRILVITEEQIRLFSLPSLKSLKYKVKLTSTEGLRIKRGILVNLHSKRDSSKTATFVFVTLNNGELRLYSLTSHKKRVRFGAISERDQIALNSMIVTSQGELLFLRHGEAEFQRSTISMSSIKFMEPYYGTLWPGYD